MRNIFIVILSSFIQINEILCQQNYGTVYPIPLIQSNDDSNFQRCPMNDGVYVHTKNCSLFHKCTNGLHTIYACIDGYFFNVINNQCQYISNKNKINCATIQKEISVLNYFPNPKLSTSKSSSQHRKSTTSICDQAGIYPDILDCSLFHYCHQNHYHEILKCPIGHSFDPKTLMCLPTKLVNCQYEPDIEIGTDRNSLCLDYAPGTYLPVENSSTEFIICQEDGTSLSMKCKSGLNYNALTTACEKGPCTFDSTLCLNEGQCIDEPSVEKGFICKCLKEYQGDYCEKAVQQEETTEELLYISEKHDSNQTTHVPFIEKANSFSTHQSSISNALSLNQFLPNYYVFTWNEEEGQTIDQITKIVLLIMSVLIGLLLLASIIYGVVLLSYHIRYIRSSGTVKWKILSEESNI